MTVLLLIPTSCAVDLRLYSASDASATGFHQDLVATGDDSRADAALVLEEWATSLTLTASLVHNIKTRDLQSARRDLQQSLLSAQKLKDLILRLDMTDTDAATFQSANHEYLMSLNELLNQTEEFDRLRDTEATYRDQKNVSGLRSVELRGDELRATIRGNYQESAELSDQVVALSQKFGLDTAEFEQSIEDFAAILADVDAVQDARSIAISKMILDLKVDSAIALEINPDHGVYGDLLSMAGTANASTGTEVVVFVDGLQAGGAEIDDSGRFSLAYTIGQLEARSHTAYASVGSDISDVNNFTIEARNTSITLSVRRIEENGVRKYIGTGRLVTEDGVPVSGATVSLNVDGRASWENGKTADNGTYTLTTEDLSPLTHTLQARFNGDGFPLHDSESAPVTVEGPPHIDWIASLVYLLAVGGAAVGGVLFLRDRRVSDDSLSTGTMAVEPASLEESHSVRTTEEAHTIADLVTVTGGSGIDRTATIMQTYRRLVQDLEARNPDLRLRSRTPRNLAVLFSDRQFGEQLRALVDVHEKVLYAEREATEEDLQRVSEAYIAILTEGNGH